MKIVVDTNVYISALVFNKKIQELLISLLEDHAVIISSFIVEELRKKLTGKFKLSSQEVDLILLQISNVTTMIIPQGNLPKVARDPDDNNILLLAEYAKADMIISGDSDLFNLKQYRSISIIKPADFES